MSAALLRHWPSFMLAGAAAALVAWAYLTRDRHLRTTWLSDKAGRQEFEAQREGRGEDG